MIISHESIANTTTAGPTKHLQHASFRWSDLWNAPLHDFPIRDEILYQYLPLRPDLDVLEIGPGSGFTAFRLSRHVHTITLAETTQEPVAELHSRLRGISNVQCICADASRPGLATLLDSDYDLVFGLDVFEYVADPRMALSNLAAVLRPGGELFLTYPNVPPPKGDGVTYFVHLYDLEQLLEDAGFNCWTISAVKLRPYASRIYEFSHELPLRLYRRLRKNNPSGRPQTFDQQWSFQQRRFLDRYKVPVHFVWLALDKILRVGGDIFTSRPVSGEILNQLVIRAWK